jgi:hypothetical protein
MSRISTQARISIAAVAAAVLVLGAFTVWMVRSTTDLEDRVTSALDGPSVAAGFRAAYDRGDTPTMCALSTGEALARLQNAGWCQQPPGWTTHTVASEHCTIPNGQEVFTYSVDPLVLGQRGMEFAIADSGNGVFRVVMFAHTADRTLCDIYR